MTQRDEVDDLCADIAEMARRISARFIPDPKKIAAFRKRRIVDDETER